MIILYPPDVCTFKNYLLPSTVKIQIPDEISSTRCIDDVGRGYGYV